MLEIRRETAENGEPKTMSTTADKAQAPVSNAKAIRSECSREIGAALKDEARAALRIGVALNLASSTFTVEEREAWQAWATSVTRKSWKTCQSYMAVAKTHGKLTRQADRRKTEAWTFEAQQALAATGEDDLRDVISQVHSTNPTPEEVREIRESVKLAKLDPAEAAEAAKAKAKRERETAASKTEELATSLKPMLKKVRSDSEFAAFLLGVEIGIAHRDAKLIGNAVKQVRQQRDAGAKAVQTAAAKLAEKTAA